MKKIAVIDLETDPFLYERIPSPFAAGFATDNESRIFWGDDCIEKLLAFLATHHNPFIIYAHNGGKFDFFYLLKYLQNPIRVVNGRILSARLGNHELRDSFAILPIPLREYAKDKTDYAMFERDAREKHKAQICEYLLHDCKYLLELVSKFVDRFGLPLTIGSAALKTLRKFHPFNNTSQKYDSAFRKYYFGGRVEAFCAGDLHGKFHSYDVNSMYPYVMAKFEHPCGPRCYDVARPSITASGNLRGFRTRPYFATITAESHGALPLRGEGKLTFPHGTFTFDACSHEIIAGLETGKLNIHTVHSATVTSGTIRFDEFVSHFVHEKILAERSGDKAGRLFAKLLMNSAYGKTAQNPENYYDWKICRLQDGIPKGFELYEILPDYDVLIARRHTTMFRYYDVAIGASITSAARSVLFRAIQSACNPIYCDTDSLICKRLNAPIDAQKLGAWKHECEFDRVAIAGKKLYAGFFRGKCLKLASKGIEATPNDILNLVGGMTIDYSRAAPTYSVSGGVRFIKRKICATV